MPSFQAFSLAQPQKFISIDEREEEGRSEIFYRVRVSLSEPGTVEYSSVEISSVAINTLSHPDVITCGRSIASLSTNGIFLLVKTTRRIDTVESMTEVVTSQVFMQCKFILMGLILRYV